MLLALVGSRSRGSTMIRQPTDRCEALGASRATLMNVNDSPTQQDPHRYAVDERLVMPETRYEVIDGEVSYVPPAGRPHATAHSRLCTLLETHVAPGYQAACDLLTRTSAKGDMAPDGSIFPSEPDAEGHRQLEHLAFEVVATETLSHAGTKAARLLERGVKRVFAVDVDRQKCLEWSERTQSWRIVSLNHSIKAPCLAQPLPYRALLDAAEADNAVCRAMLRKQNPVLTQAVAQGMRQGKLEGHREGKLEGLRKGKRKGLREGEHKGLREGERKALRKSVLTVLESRGFRLEPGERATIAGERRVPVLQRWLRASATCKRVGDVFEEA